MGKSFQFIAILSLLIAQPLYAKASSVEASRCVNGGQLRDHYLPETYRQGDFVIYYSLTGKDALPGAGNSQKTPDRILDIAQQLQVAQRFYSQNLHLTNPLHQPRYRYAKKIHVFVIALDKGNGSAFEAVAHERMAAGKHTGCGIKIMISNRLDPTKNPTPAHELFHLYQYGYSMFKQRWYLEGMTRWMETVFKPEDQAIALAASQADAGKCQLWFKQSYAAVAFWQRLAAESQQPYRVDSSLMNIRYTNGQSVIKNPEFPGAMQAKVWLTALQQLSLHVSQQEQRSAINWRETQQRDPVYNTLMCQAVVNATRH